MSEVKGESVCAALQGPLERTCGHFWQMVWQENTKGIVMLNQVIERKRVRSSVFWDSSAFG